MGSVFNINCILTRKEGQVNSFYRLQALVFLSLILFSVSVSAQVRPSIQVSSRESTHFLFRDSNGRSFPVIRLLSDNQPWAIRSLIRMVKPFMMKSRIYPGIEAQAGVPVVLYGVGFVPRSGGGFDVWAMTEHCGLGFFISDRDVASLNEGQWVDWAAARDVSRFGVSGGAQCRLTMRLSGNELQISTLHCDYNYYHAVIWNRRYSSFTVSNLTGVPGTIPAYPWNHVCVD